VRTVSRRAPSHRTSRYEECWRLLRTIRGSSSATSLALYGHSPKRVLESPAGARAALRFGRTRGASLRCRAGEPGAFRGGRFRSSRSAPLQRTRRFQGVSPLTNPLRSAAVSSGEPLAPPMGFVPLQGLLPSAGARLSAVAGRSTASCGALGPGSRLTMASHGDADRVDPSGSLPAALEDTGRASGVATAWSRFSPRCLFSFERGAHAAPRRAPRRSERRAAEQCPRSLSGWRSRAVRFPRCVGAA